MTIDTILKKFPQTIKVGNTIGYLNLGYLKDSCYASYKNILDKFICLNPDDPKTYAVSFSKSLNEALQELHDWCKEHKLIK